MVRPQRLLAVASIIMDIVIFVDQWPLRSGDILAQKGQVTPGGTFNVIAAARRLGLETIYGGLVGTGPFGQIIQERLIAMSVIQAVPAIMHQDTGFDVAIVEPDGERTFLTVNGCESLMTREHLQSLRILPGDAIYLSGYNLVMEPSQSALVKWLSMLSDEVMVVFDPGPLIEDIPENVWARVMERVDILTLNAREAFLLTRETDPKFTLLRITEKMATPARAVVRIGAEGAWIMGSHDTPCHVPSRVARVVDTTGAGDVHTAALMARLHRAVPWEQAVYEANVAASLAVERIGPSESPDQAEFDRVLQDMTVVTQERWECHHGN